MFGAGQQAKTPVPEVNGEWVEHRVSWYAGPNKLSSTPGHSFSTPVDGEAALGVVQSKLNAERCFGCHRTGDTPGVQCAACHDPKAEHPAKANTQMGPVRGMPSGSEPGGVGDAGDRRPDERAVCAGRVTGE